MATISRYAENRGPTTLPDFLHLKGSPRGGAGRSFEKPSTSFLGSETSRSSTPVTDGSAYKAPSSVSSWGVTSGSEDGDSTERGCSERDDKGSRDHKWNDDSSRSRCPSVERPCFPVTLRPSPTGRDREPDSPTNEKIGGWANATAPSRGAMGMPKSEASEGGSCVTDEEGREDEECSGDNDSMDAAIIAAVDGDLALAAYLIPLFHHCRVEGVRAKVEMWQCGTSSESGPHSSEDPRPSSSASGNNSPPTSRKRRRPASSGDGDRAGDGEGGDEDDEEDSGHPHGHSGSSLSLTPLLACPFHKINPLKYGIQHGASTGSVKSDYYRACAGPGFRSIQRLKEHLKRKHTVIQCQRCYKVFRGTGREASAKLTEHSRSDEACERGDEGLREGISTTQWAALDRQNRKKPQETHKLEKWFEIWEILFPGKDKPKTPWYDGLSIEASGPPTAESEQFASIFVNILTHKVRQGDIALHADQHTMERLKNVVQQTFRTWMSVRDECSGMHTDASSSLNGSALQSPSRVGGSSTHQSGGGPRQLTASSMTSMSPVNTLSQHPSPRHVQQQYPVMAIPHPPQFIPIPVMPATAFGNMHVATPDDMNGGMAYYTMAPQMAPGFAWPAMPYQQAMPTHHFANGPQMGAQEYMGSGDGADLINGGDGSYRPL